MSYCQQSVIHISVTLSTVMSA